MSCNIVTTVSIPSIYFWVFHGNPNVKGGERWLRKNQVEVMQHNYLPLYYILVTYYSKVPNNCSCRELICRNTDSVSVMFSANCQSLILPSSLQSVFLWTVSGQWFCVQMKLVPSNNSTFCPFLLVWMVPLNSFTFIIFHSSWILQSQLFSFIVMAVRNFIITLINRNRVTLGLLMITFGHQNQNTHFLKLFRFDDFMIFAFHY